MTSALEEFDALGRQIDDGDVMVELARELLESGDRSMLDELLRTVESVSSNIETLELQSLLSGPYDESDAIVDFHAGAGGTDAQDWAEMLLRMYSRWAERRGFAVEVDEVSEGQEAGIL